MKTIYVTFEDSDMELLQTKKGTMGWRDAILFWSGVKE